MSNEWAIAQNQLQAQLDRLTSLNDKLEEFFIRHRTTGFLPSDVDGFGEVEKITSRDEGSYFLVVRNSRRENPADDTGPCPLCHKNRYAVGGGKQFGYLLKLEETRSYVDLTVNPYPIAPSHCVFSSFSRRPLAWRNEADMEESAATFCALAKQLRAGWTLYCGSFGSIPDHWHAQALQWHGPQFPMARAAETGDDYPIPIHCFDVTQRNTVDQICRFLRRQDLKPANFLFVEPYIYVVPRRSINTKFEGGNLQSLELLGAFVTHDSRQVVFEEYWDALLQV